MLQKVTIAIAFLATIATTQAAKCSSLTCPSPKVLKASYCANCDGKSNGEPTIPTPCTTESECTASLGVCVLTANSDRISGSDITDQASCTDGKTDRTWKPAVWTTSATTDCAGNPCTVTDDAATCCAVDNSYICKVPANYVGTHSGPQFMRQETCDFVIAAYSKTTGYEGDANKAGPLAGIDFSSAYTCGSSTPADAVTAINMFQSNGCCGGNSDADSRGTCWKDNSHICKVPANYVGTQSAGMGGNTCDSLVDFYSRPVGDSTDPSAGSLLGIDFSSAYTCGSSTPAKALSTINYLASQGCCGGNSNTASADSHSTCWKDNSHICKVPANYVGTQSAGMGGNTCDSLVAMYSQPAGGSTDPSAGSLLGIDFSSAYTCGADTPAKAEAMINQLVDEGCCGGNSNTASADSRSTCWKDNSHICKVPANYVGTHVNNRGNTCDSLVAQYSQPVTAGNNYPSAGAFLGIDFSSAYTCGADTPANALTMINFLASQGCCGGNSNTASADSHSTCWKDNSFLCATPANYVGTKSMGGPGQTCDSIIGSVTTNMGGAGQFPVGTDFSSTFNCSTISTSNVGTMNVLAAQGCCGTSGVSACYVARDNSHVCKIAANYLGDHTTNAQPFGGPDQPMSCDTIVDQVLQGNDFSSVYDCSQVANDLKIKINLVASKCCGGNDGAPKSTCPPRECNFLFFFDLEIFYFLVPVISNSFSSFSCFSFPS